MINNENNKTLILDLINEQASEQLAAQLACSLTSPLIMAFNGQIGAGKTTIIRAMLRALGVQSAIKSPTFSLVESYTCPHFIIHHFDLYRIHHEDELEYIGFRDYFSSGSICCIEWAEHAGQLMPAVDIRFNLVTKGAGREIEITAWSATGKRVLACLAGVS